MRYLAAAVLVLTAPFAFAGAANIRGTVVDEHGVPVNHIVVEAWPLDMGRSGGVDRAVTDENGHFALTVASGEVDGRKYGMRWIVYPHQEDGYYADLSSRFYTTASSQARYVRFSLGKTQAVVELKLGPKAGKVRGNVTDALSGAPVNPEFVFTWASDPKNELGEATRSRYGILLPANTDIKVTVLAEKYKPWS